MLYTIRKLAEIEDEWSSRQALCLGDEELHWDGGEPEDNYFFRSWSWVPHLKQGKNERRFFQKLKRKMFCNNVGEMIKNTNNTLVNLTV